MGNGQHGHGRGHAGVWERILADAWTREAGGGLLKKKERQRVTGERFSLWRYSRGFLLEGRIPLKAEGEYGLSRIFPRYVFFPFCYDLIHISVLLYSFFWIPRHRLCWYGHHDHLFVCWIWLLVTLLCFSHILGFFVFLSVSSLTHSWVWYLVNTHRFPCLPHPFITHWFWNMKPGFLGSFHVYLFVLCFWIPFPVSNTYLWRTGWKFMLRKDILFGFLKASNKLETQTNTEDFWWCSTLASFSGFLII